VLSLIGVKPEWRREARVSEGFESGD